MPSLETNKVVKEFQRRRRQMLQNLGLTMILMALGMALVQLSDRFAGLLGIGHRGWTAIAVAQFVAAVVFALIGFQQYRCPVCSEIVRAHDKYYFGVAINPSHCPKCGTRLR